MMRLLTFFSGLLVGILGVLFLYPRRAHKKPEPSRSQTWIDIQ